MFKSDNHSGVSPQILEAIMEANQGNANSYGDDTYSKKLNKELEDIFETKISFYLTNTGTASNALALASLCPPYGNIYCHNEAHINVDECGAPELITGGAKLMPIPGEHGKICPYTLENMIKTHYSMRPHQGLPSCISITQANEAGCIYSLEELQIIQKTAKEFDLPIHMDGARFANALATLDCQPKDVTWKRGVDVLSFGGTKNGGLAAEAVIFFTDKYNKNFDLLHKRSGQLFSKTRYFSAQFLGYLNDDLWIKNAQQANLMARKLAQVLRSHEMIEVQHPVEINEVFASIPEQLVRKLRDHGYDFYQWPENPKLYRLVTSFTTVIQDIEAVNFILNGQKEVV